MIDIVAMQSYKLEFQITIHKAWVGVNSDEGIASGIIVSFSILVKTDTYKLTKERCRIACVTRERDRRLVSCLWRHCVKPPSISDLLQLMTQGQTPSYSKKFSKSKRCSSSFPICFAVLQKPSISKSSAWLVKAEQVLLKESS